MKILISAITALIAIAVFMIPPAHADNRGDEQGCPASYWASVQFAFEDAQGKLWTTEHQLDSLFSIPDRLEAYKAIPLKLALNLGDTIPDERLIREGVAAFLNAAHPDMAHPHQRAFVPIASVGPALERNNQVEIDLLADRLEDANNGICPFMPQELPEAGGIDITGGIKFGILLAAPILWIGVLLSLRGSKGV